jgi:hypothetical protein
MQQLPSSYRDADGFIFRDAGTLYRYVHPRYEKTYRQLMDSGLYETLAAKKWLVTHEEMPGHAAAREGALVLRPQYIPFISYPYEWTFDMWRDAALLTLDIAKAALEKNMVLKDATPFNIQFTNGRPIFIDTLSFALYDETQPWIAYRQFCECFLAPLLLMHYQHPGLARMFTIYPDGIPLEQLVTMLPKRSAFNINSYLHIHLQAKFSKQQKNNAKGKTVFSRKKMEVLLSGLHGYVSGLKARKAKTTWDDYYSDTILGNDYLQAKTALVKDFTKDIDIKTVVDLGANDGHFSQLFKDRATLVIATDSDPNAVNELYCKARAQKPSSILPLLNDLLAPSPSIGWNNAERASLNERLKGDLVMALALVHHLAIGKNLPLPWIAQWLQVMSPWLLVEFVPKEDEKVKALLAHREDIFDAYDATHFRTAFSDHYDIIKEATVGNTNRTLFLMKRR